MSYCIQGNCIDRAVTAQNGKGWTEGPCYTLNTVDCPAGLSVGVDGYNATETGDVSATLGVNCGMSTGRNGVCIIENYPADSRVNIDETGTVQTLTSRMGTGGGNVPMVLETRGAL